VSDTKPHRAAGHFEFDRKGREEGKSHSVHVLIIAAGRSAEHARKRIMTLAASTSSAETEPVEDYRYQAIRQRDPAYDGVFFYGVQTTGVYCRPSCAARLALLKNVSFHPSCEAAEQAGFRACKRCRPNAASQQERHAAMVRRACRLIDEAEEMPVLGDIARDVGVSPFHFHRVFKQVTGVTPKGYADARRAARVQNGLATSASVTHAIYEAGFNASSRFYEGAAERLGMTPSAYRKGGVDAAIHFAVGECSLGAVLVGMTAKGVCAIAFGDDPDALVRDLQDRFPKAELIGGDTAFEAMVAQVVGFVEAPGLGLDLPLDIRGTAFQQRVWQALRATPAGTTASYAAIAKAIGSPSAVRAVARACADNPLAVAIPCHRVVRSDGGLSGYRWGVDRKAALLQREKRAA
jgi:AraC family transcriptional regulator of adaptative response/methylated-DNA-[protein]-cysteine methyltransferase